MRVNLFGGPGSGKSTTASWLFSELKTRNVSVELVNEYIKLWSYQKRQVNEFDQIYVFGKQMQYEYRFLSNGVKNIVTDSPILLSAIYADHYFKEINIAEHIESINLEYEKKFPSINIFLNRKDKPYNEEGRYQTKEQAIEIDGLIRDKLFLSCNMDNLRFFDYNDRNNILKYVLENIHYERIQYQ